MAHASALSCLIRWLLLTLVFAGSVTSTRRVFAQSAVDKAAAAQVLFDEGMRLMSRGDAREACPKLAEAQRLDPGMATQFRLAECYEKTGRRASAWALF